MRIIQNSLIAVAVAAVSAFTPANATEAPRELKAKLSLSLATITGTEEEALPPPQAKTFTIPLVRAGGTSQESLHDLGETTRTAVLPDGRMVKIYISYRKYDGASVGMISLSAVIHDEVRGDASEAVCSGSSTGSIKPQKRSGSAETTVGCRGMQGQGWGVAFAEIELSY